MKRSRSSWIRAGACLVGLFAVAPGRADIFNDILNLTQTTTSRITTARNRATTARDNATQARDSAQEVRDNIQDAVALMTQQLRDLVNESADDVQDAVTAFTAGRDAFIADGGCSQATCQPFRADLVGMLQDLQSISNSVLAIAELQGVAVDFTQEIDLVQNAPGRVLFPLYTAMSASNLGPALLGDLSDAANALLKVRQLMAEPQDDGARGTSPLSADPIIADALAGCRTVLTDALTQQIGPGGPIQARQALRDVANVAVRIRLAGALFEAFGENWLDEFPVGVHGYVGVKIKSNFPRKLGLGLAGVGDILASSASSVSTKTHYCIALYEQEQLWVQIDSLNSCTPGSADLNGDGSVDLFDFYLFQQELGG